MHCDGFAARSARSHCACGESSPQPPDLGAVAVQDDDVPGAEVVAVPALARVAGRVAEVGEVRHGARRLVLVVADRRPRAAPCGGPRSGRSSSRSPRTDPSDRRRRRARRPCPAGRRAAPRSDSAPGVQSAMSPAASSWGQGRSGSGSRVGSGSGRARVRVRVGSGRDRGRGPGSAEPAAAVAAGRRSRPGRAGACGSGAGRRSPAGGRRTDLAAHARRRARRGPPCRARLHSDAVAAAVARADQVVARARRSTCRRRDVASQPVVAGRSAPGPR